MLKVLPEWLLFRLRSRGTQPFKLRDTPENAEADSTTAKTRSATNIRPAGVLWSAMARHRFFYGDLLTFVSQTKEVQVSALQN
jgi:hypothetical protein